MGKKVIKVDFKKENKIKELDEKIEKLKDELAYNIDIGNINEVSKKERNKERKKERKRNSNCHVWEKHGGKLKQREQKFPVFFICFSI